MKAYFIHPDCTLSENPENHWKEPPTDCIYLEGKFGTTCAFLADLEDAGFIQGVKQLAAIDNPEDHLEFCFLLAVDYSRIIQIHWAWARSAMNTEKDKFIKFKEPFEFYNLSELTEYLKNLSTTE